MNRCSKAMVNRMVDRTGFNTQPAKKKEVDKLIKKKPDVKISGEDDFGTTSLIQPKKSVKQKRTLNEDIRQPLTEIQERKSVSKKRSARQGRPIEITDDRYKATKPKVISPALNSKLDVLQDYVDELSTIEGRVSFDKYIDTLAEVYISLKLNADKQEHLRAEIEEAFNRIK